MLLLRRPSATMIGVLVLCVLLHSASAASAKPAALDGAWLRSAVPTKLTPPVPPQNCMCAPDPLLPNPECILCYCAGIQGDVGVELLARNSSACILSGAAPTKLKYSTGKEAECLCAPDPLLTNPAWLMCRCPKTLTPADFKGKHVLVFMTDQERAIQHFPPGWEAQNLPGMTRLKRNGLTFKRAYTNACMCTPARSSFFTGYTTAQTTSFYTIETDMPSSKYPQNPLPKPYNQPGGPRNAIANLAQMARAAGYQTVYKGKFHLTKPSSPSGNYTQADLAAYGWARWNPRDAGADQSLYEGGGNPLGGGDNDNRFMNSVGRGENEGVLQYIRDVLPRATKPVFLIVSIVNPHDVLFYPKTFDESGYDPSMLEGTISPPITANESLATKPFAQKWFVTYSKAGNVGPTQTLEEQTRYINFYGNLMKLSDSYLVNTLDALEAEGLLDRTLIVRTADHGEMGLAHGNQIQKNFNMYEEATRVPLVFSNPQLWPTPKQTHALVSHIDFAPTIQTLLGVKRPFKTAGVDYSSIVMKPDLARPVQDHVIFTYNDYQSGQKNPPYAPGPAFIRGVIEKEWKIAQYYDPDASRNASQTETVQWECYNLRTDPLEIRNLGHPSAVLTAAERVQLARLKAKLLRVTAARLGPLPGFEWDVNLTANVSAAGFGLAAGQPIGEGQVRVTWKRPAGWWQRRWTGTFAFRSRSGQLVGTMEGRATTNAASGTTLVVGTARVTDGSGAYRGLRSLPYAPLRMRYVQGVELRGTLALQGRVAAGAVDGSLNLGTLDPSKPPPKPYNKPRRAQ